MGCDGGTIPKRDELVRTKKKAEEKDKHSERFFKWGHCSITQEPLQKPIVACQLGRLYSKVAVIEAILDKTKLPETANHIKSIKDVKELNLTTNPEYVAKAKTSETNDDCLIAPYICPVIGLEMSGKYRFSFIWSCGCVISERALKAVASKECHKCQKEFCEEDIVVLNGTDADIIVARERMQARKKKSKETKKSQKASEVDSATQPESKQVASTSASSSASGATKRSAPVDLIDPLFKKTRPDYSVAKDPKASKVYKSLFTSHDSAKNKTSAHWVTYNPFYN